MTVLLHSVVRERCTMSWRHPGQSAQVHMLFYGTSLHVIGTLPPTVYTWHRFTAPPWDFLHVTSSQNHPPQGPLEKEDCHSRQPPRVRCILHVVAGRATARKAGLPLRRPSSAAQPRGRLIKESTVKESTTHIHWNLQFTLELTVYNSLWRTSSTHAGKLVHLLQPTTYPLKSYKLSLTSEHRM